MPTYRFECKKCKETYEEFGLDYDETGKYKGVKCPKCKSKSKIQVIAWGGGYTFAQPEGTDRWNNSHDFRYHTKVNDPISGAKAVRANAEKKSHMGSKPYRNIDDISSGKHFGEVK